MPQKGARYFWSKEIGQRLDKFLLISKIGNEIFVKLSIILILSFFLSISAFCQVVGEYNLFEGFDFAKYSIRNSEDILEIFSHDYERKIEEIISQLKNGGEVKLIFDTADGAKKIFIVTNLLSARSPGNTTYVFETKDGSALRLPMFESSFDRSKRDIWNFMSRYVEGSKELTDHALNIVKVLDYYNYENTPPSYIEVEKLDILFDLDEYWVYLKLHNKTITDQLNSIGLTQDEVSYRLTKELVKSWTLTNIGDIHPGQLGFTRDGKWVLFDFTDGTRAIKTSQISLGGTILGFLSPDATAFSTDESTAILEAARAEIIDFRLMAIDGKIKLPHENKLNKGVSQKVLKGWCSDAFGAGP